MIKTFIHFHNKKENKKLNYYKKNNYKNKIKNIFLKIKPQKNIIKTKKQKNNNKKKSKNHFLILSIHSLITLSAFSLVYP